MACDAPAPPGPRAAKVGLALACGGPEGAIYEIGALRALEEAVGGLDLNNLLVYVGVSAGAFIAANLANNLTTAQMCRAIVKPEPGEHPFIPETFFTPDFAELRKSGRAVPRLLAQSLWDYVSHWQGRTLVGSLLRLSRALPIGLFDPEPIRLYLERIYNIKGRTDDFRRLAKRLVIVASDLDTGKPARFGEPGLDHVPISRAIAASGALPGLYSPVEIDGRHYVDGILHKTVHASVALEAGAELVLCINPIVPLHTDEVIEAGLMPPGNLRQHGLPAVVSQTFRTLIRSRLEVGMASYRTRYDAADLVLFEPATDDYLMFDTNIFSFAERRAVAEHAYRTTRERLLGQFESLAPTFARHGLVLRREVLEDAGRDLWEGVGLGRGRPALAAAPREPSGSALVRRLDEALRQLERLVEQQQG